MEDTVQLTIELTPYEIAFLIAEEGRMLAEWNTSEMYDILNAIRAAVNTADAATQSKIARAFQEGIYYQSDSDKWRGEDGVLAEVEELTEPI